MQLPQFIQRMLGFAEKVEKGIEVEIKAVRDELAQVKGELTQTKADLATAKQTISTLEASVQTKDAEITTLKGEVKAKQEIIDKPDGEIQRQANIKAQSIVASSGHVAAKEEKKNGDSKNGGQTLSEQFAAITDPQKRTAFWREHGADILKENRA